MLHKWYALSGPSYLVTLLCNMRWAEEKDIKAHTTEINLFLIVFIKPTIVS